MTNTITYRNLKDRDRTVAGRVYEGNTTDGAHADVTPGKSIRLYGIEDYKGPYDITFNVGDEAIHGSYNFVYTGKILKIGPKTVTVDAGDIGSKPKRLTVYNFSGRNRGYDADAIAARNARTSLEI